ncbi:MAG TPA: antibiotic biosynthesis monooxygenase [Thermoanaerobaculia bacterium]|nr:antibiotic biosynthesis monooxygenase [Thermoanaerobaculia bacterium]
MTDGRRRIARIWRGRTPASRADEYADFLVRRALPDYRAIAGNRGAQILRRTEGDVAEFVVVSVWDGEDAIRRFAGDDPARAVYYPEDDAFLLEKEPTVTHYEVFE